MAEPTRESMGEAFLQTLTRAAAGDRASSSTDQYGTMLKNPPENVDADRKINPIAAALMIMGDAMQGAGRGTPWNDSIGKIRRNREMRANRANRQNMDAYQMQLRGAGFDMEQARRSEEMASRDKRDQMNRDAAQRGETQRRTERKEEIGLEQERFDETNRLAREAEDREAKRREKEILLRKGDPKATMDYESDSVVLRESKRAAMGMLAEFKQTGKGSLDEAMETLAMSIYADASSPEEAERMVEEVRGYLGMFWPAEEQPTPQGPGLLSQIGESIGPPGGASLSDLVRALGGGGSPAPAPVTQDDANLQKQLALLQAMREARLPTGQ